MNSNLQVLDVGHGNMKIKVDGQLLSARSAYLRFSEQTKCVVDIRTFYHWLKRGYVPYTKVRHIYIKQEDIDEFIEEFKQGGLMVNRMGWK